MLHTDFQLGKGIVDVSIRRRNLVASIRLWLRGHRRSVHQLYHLARLADLINYRLSLEKLNVFVIDITGHQLEDNGGLVSLPLGSNTSSQYRFKEQFRDSESLG